MTSHPLMTVRGALLKVMAAFSWRMSPAREGMTQLVYFLSYLPVSILGVIGMILTRRQWRQHCLIYLLFLSFVGLTAVFWGHTSHRSHLDVYWIIFAGYVIGRFAPARFSSLLAAPTSA
jgi:hypothetical protein